MVNKKDVKNTTINKTLHRKLKIEQHKSYKNQGVKELMCSGRVNSSWLIT